MIRKFNTYLDKIDSEFWGRLCIEQGELYSIRKGEEFISIDYVAKYIGLIKEGAFKYLIYSSTGEEKTIGLETVGGFCASWPYCLSGKPSVASIIACTDSKIYRFPVSKIMEMADNDPGFKCKIHKVTEEIFYTAYNRLIEFYSLSPKERYDKLFERCPRMFEIFTLRDIASYLNITPSHLSRLRRN